MCSAELILGEGLQYIHYPRTAYGLSLAFGVHAQGYHGSSLAVRKRCRYEGLNTYSYTYTLGFRRDVPRRSQQEEEEAARTAVPPPVWTTGICFHALALPLSNPADH